MNPFKKVISSIFNPLKIIPSSSTIDKSGIVKSDHPVKGNGWIKGWVVNIKPKNIIIVCKHSNPSTTEPNNKVFVIDSSGIKHTRTIISINKNPFKLNGKDDCLEYYDGGDIAICKLDKPFPNTVKGYDISTNKDIYASKALTIDQDGNDSIAQIRCDDNFAYIRGKKRWGNLLIAGDSGMPWFVWEDKEWKVLTHTFRGQWGEGPWYGHKNIYDELYQRINDLQH